MKKQFTNVRTVNYYYDNTEERKHTDDDEGNLVQLCGKCAHELRHEVSFAQDGDEYNICEKCEREQD